MQKLTNSRANSFKECPRKHYYLYEKGIRTKKLEAPLRFGSQFHLGKYVYNTSGNLENALIEAVNAYSDIPAWIITPDEHRAFNDERIQLVELLAGNIEYWNDDPDPVQIIHPEQTFDVPIINPKTGRESRTFSAAGQRDAIATWRGQYVLLEYKTTASDLSPDSPYWMKLMMDSQINHYYLSALLDGIPLTTVLYEVTKKPSGTFKASLDIAVPDEDGKKVIRWNGTGDRVLNKNGSPAQRSPAGEAENTYLETRPETDEEYAERLRNDIRARPEHYYHRHEIARTPTEIYEYQQELWQICGAIRKAKNEKYWYKNTGSCFKWHNKRPCPYWDACVNGVELDKIEPHELAERGFEILENVHPELIN